MFSRVQTHDFCGIFEPIRDTTARDLVCRAFADTYLVEGAKVPQETQECRDALSLTIADIALGVGIFFIGELILSRLLFRAHLRDEPY